jgi:cation transporter-like permease
VEFEVGFCFGSRYSISVLAHLVSSLVAPTLPSLLDRFAIVLILVKIILVLVVCALDTATYAHINHDDNERMKSRLCCL